MAKWKAAGHAVIAVDALADGKLARKDTGTAPALAAANGTSASSAVAPVTNGTPAVGSAAGGKPPLAPGHPHGPAGDSNATPSLSSVARQISGAGPKAGDPARTARAGSTGSAPGDAPPGAASSVMPFSPLTVVFKDIKYTLRVRPR